MKWIFTSIIWALVVTVVLLSYRISLDSVNTLIWCVFGLLVTVLIFFAYLSRKEQQSVLHKETLDELWNKYSTLRAQYDSTTHSLQQRIRTLEKANKEQQRELDEWKKTSKTGRKKLKRETATQRNRLTKTPY